jgi:hypothetical protein
MYMRSLTLFLLFYYYKAPVSCFTRKARMSISLPASRLSVGRKKPPKTQYDRM